MEIEKNNDEIDFGPVFLWSKRIIFFIVKTIINWLKLLWGNKFKIIITSVLFAAILIGSTVLMKPYFRSETTFNSRMADNKIHYDKIMTINSLLAEGGTEEIGNLLKISTNDAEKIASLEFQMKEDTYSDSLFTPNLFKVIVNVYENVVLDTLQTSLLNYLSDIDFINKSKKLEKVRLTKLINKLDIEINELDSLKRIVETSLILNEGNQGLVYGEPLDPVAVHKESIALYEKKLRLEIKLQTLDLVEIATPFSKHEEKAFPKKLNFALLGLALGIAISCLFVTLRGHKN